MALISASKAQCEPWFGNKFIEPAANLSPEQAQEKALAMVRETVAELVKALEGK